MTEDGYSENVNYIRLSSDFPYFHRNIFGLYKTYKVDYTDSSGIERSAVIPYFTPPTNSVKNKKNERIKKRKKLTSHQKKNKIRSLKFDSSYALMTVNGFSNGNLKNFFRKSFHTFRKKGTQHLIIDLRANGGGDMIKSVVLAKYLMNKAFKVADTSYSISKNLVPYTKYISSGFFNNLGLLFVTHKEKDSKYHFGYWERHTFKPKKKNHFKGHVYILTNGFTFSASSLFCNLLKGQENVTLAGEDTGGGWYGNSGIMIPNITLPNTHLRVRLPFFRLVQYQHIPVKGTGVIPDVYVGPDWRDILNDVDTKIEVVKELINHPD